MMARSRTRRCGIAGMVAAMGAGAIDANAMQFEADRLDNGVAGITAVRPIVPGDMERLQGILGSLPPKSRVVAFALDSPGGNLSEAYKIATFVSRAQLLVAVPAGATCASACFLPWVAKSLRCRRLPRSSVTISTQCATQFASHGATARPRGRSTD